MRAAALRSRFTVACTTMRPAPRCPDRAPTDGKEPVTSRNNERTKVVVGAAAGRGAAAGQGAEQ
jgi:hypothetical protein